MYTKRLVLFRLYVYGLHGIAVELFYTALWHLIADGNFKLQGYTSLYIFFIYAVQVAGIEIAAPQLKAAGLPWYLRGVLYTFWTYSWEFTTGYVLKYFDACPWDYEPWFSNHFMGLVTMEYAPFWFGGSLLAEFVVAKYALEFCRYLRPLLEGVKDE